MPRKADGSERTERPQWGSQLPSVPAAGVTGAHRMQPPERRGANSLLRGGGNLEAVRHRLSTAAGARRAECAGLGGGGRAQEEDRGDAALGQRTSGRSKK
ncbi:hypothetical protein GCM10018987_53070 [Streptomyces cremeus]